MEIAEVDRELMYFYDFSGARGLQGGDQTFVEL